MTEFTFNNSSVTFSGVLFYIYQIWKKHCSDPVFARMHARKPDFFSDR